jgi:NAD(P)-dependent dehydrogenase (short-subunit alcohol dehydrogenase family)
MLAPYTLSSRTVFITCAGTGIGRGFALRAAIPAGRFETIEETVEIGLLLCTPTANYINGEILVADGDQWLNKGVFTLPEPGQRYSKV